MGCHCVAAPANPVYQMGGFPPQRRMQQTVWAPKTPIHQLGAVAPQVIAASAPFAAIGTSAAITAAAAGSGAAYGAFAGPIGAAVGVVVGLIAGFWSAHDARAAGAKDENAAMNSAVTAFDQSIKAVFAAANSTNPAQQITAAQAISLCSQVLQSYWAGMAPHQTGPGRADASNHGASCSGLTCNSSCTAGCCVGCLDLTPSIANCIAVFQAGGGTAQILAVYGSSYGGVARGAYSLTYTPPPQAAATVASAGSNIVSDISSLFSPNTVGVSTAPGAAVSSPSILPLLLLGVAAFLVMR